MTEVKNFYSLCRIHNSFLFKYPMGRGRKKQVNKITRGGKKTGRGPSGGSASTSSGKEARKELSEVLIHDSDSEANQSTRSTDAEQEPSSNSDTDHHQGDSGAQTTPGQVSSNPLQETPDNNVSEPRTILRPNSGKSKKKTSEGWNHFERRVYVQLVKNGEWIRIGTTIDHSDKDGEMRQVTVSEKMGVHREVRGICNYCGGELGLGTAGTSTPMFNHLRAEHKAIYMKTQYAIDRGDADGNGNEINHKDPKQPLLGFGYSHKVHFQFFKDKIY